MESFQTIPALKKDLQILVIRLQNAINFQDVNEAGNLAIELAKKEADVLIEAIPETEEKIKLVE